MALQQIPEPSSAGLQPKYQKFTSSGTFTLPSGYGAGKPLLVNIQVIGGGGGGSWSRMNAATLTAPAGTNLNGTSSSYFGNNGTFIFNCAAKNDIAFAVYDAVNVNNGSGGGSGGLSQTQMYLTSNLTITVGAAGTRASIATPSNLSFFTNYGGPTSGNAMQITPDNTFGARANFDVNGGGSGGTSTAGALSATGGNPANTGNVQIDTALQNYNTQSSVGNGSVNQAANYNANATVNAINGNASGTAGQPAGSAGDAVPLLGTVAGGSGTATPVYGSFGIGGVKTDGAAHTGVEGTGGGMGSVGSSGAVILTWWE
jgi:hypothetical protein